MKIIVWGLGYIGAVVAGSLAEMGHEVIGIDKMAETVERINRGKSPIKEPGLEELISSGIRNQRLWATTEGSQWVQEADLSLICVGTPSAPDGTPILDFVKNVAIEIAEGLRHSDHYHGIVLRSTVFPGTTRHVLTPLLEQYSHKRVGQDFGVAVNPEFLREMSAIADFNDPPYTLIGTMDRKIQVPLQKLYESLSAPIHFVTPESAELLKLTNNAFHALKITFANEVGRLAEALNIDGQQVMDLVCADQKLNISPLYLQPGFAFGGSCLPKDVRSLNRGCDRLGVEVPLLNAILPSNQAQIDAVRLRIHHLGASRVAILGLCFKPHTDDIRESPVIPLIQKLWQDGIHIRVTDPDLDVGQLNGSSHQYLQRQLPQFNHIFTPSLHHALDETEAVILTQNRPIFEEILQDISPKIPILNLAHPKR